MNHDISEEDVLFLELFEAPKYRAFVGRGCVVFFRISFLPVELSETFFF